ncbi:Gx transporter family protein [Paenibacillus sp. YN15]|uniref:Gx transporter family protein n=1 Tax=Paenibacillus sp. YN15 TaxID=1742774 RepID=UPI000DCB9C2D|nr:Gx transporter family protein [Paenibacillus sp. YN15]RAV04691.1 heptaprenyl diphosphate synthase [Paenibacillus sp. YN15]
MALHPERDREELKTAAMVAILAAVSVVLGIVESFIPFAIAVPGAKLGLGNIMVLTCLYYFKGQDALALIVLKTLLTSFILGTFSTFLFSLFGSLASFLIMFVLLRVRKDFFSLAAISIMGGIAHNLGQLGAAALVLGTTSIFYYLPLLLVSGVVTGFFIGVAATYLIGSLDNLGLLQQRAGGAR